VIEADITYSTTVATTTVGDDPGAVALPSGFPEIAHVPTTQYLQGVDGIAEVHVKGYWKDTGLVRINRQAVKYNILKLHYRSLGDLVR